jgi:iron complex outermembrane receptor protein
MQYKNQLVLTGEINDVGAYTRTNIENSYRRGVEIEGAFRLNSKINLAANITLSENKINDYTAYIDNWDTGIQQEANYNNTDLAFSPNIIWSSMINYKLNTNTSIDFISKYVGKQFIDNTHSIDRVLNDYLINNLRISYEWKNKIFKTAKITLQINNLLNNEYVSNAWVYRFISDNFDPRESDPYVNADGERGYNMAGYFPQATRNYLLGVTLGL